MMHFPQRSTNFRVLLGAVLLLLVAACGGDGTTDDTADPTGTDAGQAEPDGDGDDGAATDGDGGAGADDATDEPVTLRLLTHDSFDVSDDVLAEFTDETDIDVEVVPSGDAGQVVNQAILTKDSPQGDLLFGVDNTFLSRALEEDLFAAYESPLLDVVPDRLELDPQNRVTPITYGDVCINYDKSWFDESDVPVPTELSDLTDEAYRDLFVVTNPATSSPGLAFMLATIQQFGEDGWLDFWQQLRDNGVLVTDGWSEAYYGEFTAASEGDRPLVVSYASSPPAEVFFADPQPDEAPTGVIEASCFRQVEFVGILASTEHEEAAQQLVDFMLGRTFQEDVPLTMFVFPANDEAELPDVYREHAVVPDDPLEMDPQEIGEGREAWIEEWTTTVLR